MMILVDKEIKRLVQEGFLIIENYQEKNVNNVSYDLTVDTIVNCEEDSIKLETGNFAIIKTLEKIRIPNYLLGRIEEKNSLLRFGLIVNGPCYQPGHTTYCYLRIQNISENPILIKKGFVIAQIVFEELKEVPDITYADQENASFQNEDQYREYGNYTSTYQTL